MRAYLSQLQMSMKSFDLFAFFNTFLFLMMLMFVYYDRFITYRGAANLHEFFLYAIVIFLAICYAWLKFRHMDISIYALVLIEITILVHFAGAFVEVDGRRLYEFRVFDIRYDKFVHFMNSLIGSWIVLYIFKKNYLEPSRLILSATVLMVLGIGAIIEIMEFIVTLTVVHNGVGSYFNNMSDLVANLIGAILGVKLYTIYKRAKS